MPYDIIEIPSENFNSRAGTEIELIIIHAVGLDLETTLRGFTFKNGDKGGLGVSPHYLIPQMTAEAFLTAFAEKFNLRCTPRYPHQVPVIKCVDEKDRAWHAGTSKWGTFNARPGCEQSLNSCSIGIEFHTPGYGLGGEDWFHFTPFTIEQMATGAELIKDISQRHHIQPANLIGHSDIAPWHPSYIKTDPGPLFPWKWLYEEHQLGIWPSLATKLERLEPENSQDYVRRQLQKIGYNVCQSLEWTDLDRHSINAFRMHFMQDSYHLVRPTDKEFGKVDINLIDCLNRMTGNL
ncbi:N-acetylmuramoyl-L-alanine amidase [Candidatus Odyssella thessalonicensis]|uniref:N-acetylmuramoyl-L-alanine amidase n=1 Tax=Candidatus Odyssella thessalonicensis TaxID=84647 RepID=UPI000225A8A0|nr:N-acetylmuramoyl-L-alanine amidase [Candidatus Odyssella thessalonicensis]